LTPEVEDLWAWRRRCLNRDDRQQLIWVGEKLLAAIFDQLLPTWETARFTVKRNLRGQLVARLREVSNDHGYPVVGWLEISQATKSLLAAAAVDLVADRRVLTSIEVTVKRGIEPGSLTQIVNGKSCVTR
jgi:hypothetical protein